MAGRKVYYKAAEVSLGGPHHGRGLVYLPGRTYRPDYLDDDPNISCTHGLYFTSHRRVAARWGPVVLQVEVTGNIVRVLKPVKPTHTPSDIEQGRYIKYRTDNLLVKRVVGIAVYGEPSEHNPKLWDSITRLNRVLERHGVPGVTYNGVVLETLRSEKFKLYGVEHVKSLETNYNAERAMYLREMEKLRRRQAEERDALGQRHLREEHEVKSLYPGVVL